MMPTPRNGMENFITKWPVSKLIESRRRIPPSNLIEEAAHFFSLPTRASDNITPPFFFLRSQSDKQRGIQCSGSRSVVLQPQRGGDHQGEYGEAGGDQARPVLAHRVEAPRLAVAHHRVCTARHSVAPARSISHRPSQQRRRTHKNPSISDVTYLRTIPARTGRSRRRSCPGS